jgi:hypothetical protein
MVTLIAGVVGDSRTGKVVWTNVTSAARAKQMSACYNYMAYTRKKGFGELGWLELLWWLALGQVSPSMITLPLSVVVDSGGIHMTLMRCSQCAANIGSSNTTIIVGRCRCMFTAVSVDLNFVAVVVVAVKFSIAVE